MGLMWNFCVTSWQMAARISEELLLTLLAAAVLIPINSRILSCAYRIYRTASHFAAIEAAVSSAFKDASLESTAASIFVILPVIPFFIGRGVVFAISRPFCITI